MAPASLLLLASAAAANAAAEGPWLDGFNGTFPCDVLFVKGKKVAGTTLGGVVRRLGGRHGVDFFSPGVPAKTPADWRSGGRERWILDEFAAFAARRAPGRHLGWGQEQTLSPRRRGLEASSRPLVDLAAGAYMLQAWGALEAFEGNIVESRLLLRRAVALDGRNAVAYETWAALERDHGSVRESDRLMGIVKRLRLESPQSGGGGEGPLLDMGAWGLGPPAAGP